MLTWCYMFVYNGVNVCGRYLKLGAAMLLASQPTSHNERIINQVVFQRNLICNLYLTPFKLFVKPTVVTELVCAI